MKTIKSLALIFIILLFASASALAWQNIPDKYNLGGRLEKVARITHYHFISWQTMDDQSFVLQTSPKDYYLIVLNGPSDRLLYTHTIKINTTNSTVQPGYNSVVVEGPAHAPGQTFIINRIYKFKDAAQIKVIKKFITSQE